MIHLHQIDPIAIQFPAFELLGRTFQPSIHWHGIMYLLAFAAAWRLGRRRVAGGRLPGVAADACGDLRCCGMLGVGLGGRVGSVLFYACPELGRAPLMIVRLWDGGMSFHGGLLGVLLASWIWARRQRLRFCD